MAANLAFAGPGRTVLALELWNPCPCAVWLPFVTSIQHKGHAEVRPLKGAASFGPSKAESAHVFIIVPKWTGAIEIWALP